MTAFWSTLIERTGAELGRECVSGTADSTADELAELELETTALQSHNYHTLRTECA